MSDDAGAFQSNPIRRELILALCIAAGCFTLYALGACRTIYVGDSGELVAAVHVLGIPHPSGYPLYVLLGKLWTLLVPLGSIAYRMSLFSAVGASMACAILYLVSRENGTGRPAAAFGALLLAAAPSYWLEANTQRVYALNALMLVIAVRFALRWWTARRPGELAAAMLACGLGATNHMFMALAGVAIALFALATDPGLLRRPREIASSALAFIGGLVVYVYLPIRSRMNPVLDWGNPETVQAFLDVVLRRGFWSRAWYSSPGDLIAVASDFFGSVVVELAWIGLPLALLAVASYRRYRGRILLPLAIVAVNVAAMAAHGSYFDIFVWHRYYIPSYAMISLLAAFGLHVVADRLNRVALIALAVPLAMITTGYAKNDRSTYRVAADYSAKVLAATPPGATLVATDDNVLFVLLYLHYVDGVRPDVRLIPAGIDQPKPNIAFNPDEDAIIFTHHPNWNVPGLEIVPVGLVLRAIRAGQPTPAVIEPGPLAGETDPAVPKDFLTEGLIGNYHFMLGFTFEQSDWPRARRELEAALSAAPRADVVAYNVGLIFERNGLYDDAIRAFEICQKNNPRGIAAAFIPHEGKASERILGSEKARAVRAERARVSAVEARILISAAMAGLDRSSAAFHLAMAERLAEIGERVAARGHVIKAEAAVADP